MFEHRGSSTGASTFPDIRLVVEGRKFLGCASCAPVHAWLRASGGGDAVVEFGIWEWRSGMLGPFFWYASHAPASAGAAGTTKAKRRKSESSLEQAGLVKIETAAKQNRTGQGGERRGEAGSNRTMMVPAPTESVKKM
mmetsp:Transcript_67453/g.140953  ORF Transcript_67453/g.140953 Transcript_67453/m.140953 type:complete len:138 (+) Transcript_67453:238-651(+)|eukprot:CAMPEP_0206438550 /NCGR_PEP_ID=MMETSP0324_2-20121206/11697_1 /ASSEMBLY_ACC=CAM_ASM_000836 /TAXON_ID=2866 /ORGANISM="Crypthecodinium cohnii, Strain Seligo" /LENGTH=137 /DNA_ID=CAMNT_0053906031 /DNA_START=182 /DNA_END=595 /DNA_ORIENTATION=-